MNDDNTTEEQRIISFCTGFGGIELGLRLAGLNARTVMYVEIEAYAIANLVAKIEEGKMDPAPIWTDIKTFPAEMFSGKVHGIIGGYPCQPFSAAGKRKGTDDPRHLWPYIERAIELIRPRWCFFENVEGHLTLGFRNVCNDLGELGYRTTAGLFSASEVGASHQRKRLFILAHSRHMSRSGEQQLMVKKRGEGSGARKSGEAMGNSSESEGAGDSRELADTCRTRSKARVSGQDEGEEGNPKESDNSSNRWPARPGQEQYDWEEPRCIESIVGRTTARTDSGLDATANRVDRLRLLGNGVVRQTAAKAWIELTEELEL